MAGIPVSLAASIILARGLGVETFGEYSFIMALVPILALPVSGGLAQLLTRQVARYSHGAQWGLYRGIVASAHLWVLIVSTMIIAIFFVLRELVPELLTGKRWFLLSYAIFLIPLIGLNEVRNGIIKGLGLPLYAELPGQFIQPLLLLATVLILFHLFSHSGIVAINSQLLAYGITVIFATLILLHVKPLVPSIQPVMQVKQWLCSLLPFSMITLVGLFNVQIGIILLGFLGSPEDISGIRVAERGSQFVALSLAVVNLIIAPHIVRAYTDKNYERLQKIVKNSARGAFFIALPIAFSLIIFGRWIITFLYGAEYAVVAYLPLVIIASGQLFNVFCGSVGIILSMGGYEKSTLQGQFMGLISNILVCIVLIPAYGAVGAAIGVTTGLVVWNMTLTYLVVKKVNIRPFPI